MKSDKILMSIVIILFIAVITFASTVFTVKEWERGLKFQFGEFSGEELQPGLNFKFPFVNTIKTYDVRIQTMDTHIIGFNSIHKWKFKVQTRL